jgi:glucokinase
MRGCHEPASRHTASGGAPAVLIFPVLVGDIGGTYARFAVLGAAEHSRSRLVRSLTAAHATPAAAIRAALGELAGERPRSALLALAGRVDAPVVPLTNAAWVIDAARIGLEFDLQRVVLVNDYVPVAAALPAFDQHADARLARIGPPPSAAAGTRLAIGPGTGLGAAALVQTGARRAIQATEAAHTDFGACEDRDFAVWPLLEKVRGRVTAESILSGPGLVRLYDAFVRMRSGMPSCTTPAEVIEAARKATDASAAEALLAFVRLLGRFAGDLALTFGAAGGVYLAGGIAPRIVDLLEAGEFRAAFERKAPFETQMRRIPTFVITDPEPAITGLAVLARTWGDVIFEAQGWSAALGGDPRGGSVADCARHATQR